MVLGKQRRQRDRVRGETERGMRLRESERGHWGPGSGGKDAGIKRARKP